MCISKNLLDINLLLKACVGLGDGLRFLSALQVFNFKTADNMTSMCPKVKTPRDPNNLLSPFENYSYVTSKLFPTQANCFCKTERGSNSLVQCTVGYTL